MQHTPPRGNTGSTALNNYVATIQKMGLDAYMKVAQSAYARYVSLK
ncbi:hypothetical protein [Paenibacillus koleovorans]|nr:hypothetical protein [Paenibacillus koleovorans]